VSISLSDYNPTFRFSTVASLRVDAIEELRNPFSSTDPDYWDSTATVMLGQSAFGAPSRFEVTSEAEVANAMSELEKRFKDTILPFLDAHVGLPAVERLLNGSIDRDKGGALDKRALAGVAAAALCRRPDYQEIVAQHRECISGYYEDAGRRFEALVAHIAALS
jgi:hypothetical protein